MLVGSERGHCSLGSGLVCGIIVRQSGCESLIVMAHRGAGLLLAVRVFRVDHLTVFPERIIQFLSALIASTKRLEIFRFKIRRQQETVLDLSSLRRVIID